MKRNNNDAKTLGRFLDRFFRPSSEQIRSARDRVLQRIQTETEGALDGVIGDSVMSRALEERIVLSDPAPFFAWRRIAMASALAAALLAVFVGTAIVGRQDAPAVVDNADGGLYRIVEGKAQSLRAGERLAMGETIHSNGGAGGTLLLADGSFVEMRPKSELALEAAPDGLRIRLNAGNIIVTAAKQRDGHLYVQTKDMMVSVVGTVFLVNAEEERSRVAVIEGEVRVQHGGTESTLLPGEQLATKATSPTNASRESLILPLPHSAVPAAAPTQETPETFESILAAKLEALGKALQSKAPIQAPPVTQPLTRPANTPKWEVVSIRPCGDPTTEPNVRAGGMGTSPGILRVTCLSVQWLAERAYVKWSDPEVRKPKKMYPISGGPSWVETELYTINAKAEGTPTDQELRGPMLQALLEDRFRLRMRREIREERVYELRIAESGLKMNAVKEEECELTPEQKEAHAKEVAEANKNGPVPIALALDRCGWVGAGSPPSGTRGVEGHGANIDALVQWLPKEPIIFDKTGLKGRFDFKLIFRPDPNTALEPSSLLPEAPVGYGSLLVEIEKQLGLKLVPVQGPRDYYVIEYVERPSPN